MASHRRTAAAVVAVALASVSLYPIFTGMAWFWVGCATAIVMALTGTLTRLRRLPVAVVLLGYVVALLLWLNFTFSNAKSLWHLLPTPTSLAALFDIAGQGFNEAARYAPPVPELRGMLLLAAAGIGIAAACTDLIAVRLSSAALAGLPLLLVFTEPFTLSVSRGFLGTAIAFCVGVAGYLALLSSEGRERIRQWEQPGPSTRSEPDTRTLAAAGRRVGFASAVLALCLPLFIPGLHTTRLFGGEPGIGGSGGGAGSGGFGGTVGFPDPNTQVSQELHTTQPETVLSYTTTDNSDPSYLQIYTLDKLTGTGWQLFAQPADMVPVRPSLPAAPGLTASGPSVAKETTTIGFVPSFGSDAYGALPAPYPATTVRANGNVRADRSTLMLFDPGVSFGGMKYTVTSLDVGPSTQALSVAPPPPASISSHYLSVPSAYDPLRSLAASITKAAGAKNKLTEAIALQNWLAEGTFKYTLNAPTVLNAATLTRFLKTTKAGYCQQFSFSMAVLARLLGIPTRIAYGFTSGTLQNTGDWVVTTHDAHSWPELYFQGYGWLRFEPTPGGVGGQSTAFAPAYSILLPSGSSSSQGQAAPAVGTTTAPTGNLGHRFQFPSSPSQEQMSGPRSVSPWELAGLVIAFLIVIAAAAPWCARRVVRLRRWRRRARGTGSHTGAGRADRVLARDIAWAHAAWAELRDDLMDYGAACPPSESPRAAAARAGTGLRLAEPARAALGRIAMAEERARYASTPTDGSGLREDSTVVRRAIATAVPRHSRWRARLLPASVVTPALNALAATADLYRGSLKAFSWRRGDRG